MTRGEFNATLARVQAEQAGWREVAELYERRAKRARRTDRAHALDDAADARANEESCSRRAEKMLEARRRSLPMRIEEHEARLERAQLKLRGLKRIAERRGW